MTYVHRNSTVRAGRRRSNPSSPAKFTLFAATYQKGDKEGQLTGNIYFRGKPHYSQNEQFKELFHKLTLAERLKWNSELKLYTVKVYTATQARLVRSWEKERTGCDVLCSCPCTCMSYEYRT